MTVTAEDGVSTVTYSVVVTRAASSDATLSALALAEGTLSPTFSSDVLAYTADVGNEITSVTVTATVTVAVTVTVTVKVAMTMTVTVTVTVTVMVTVTVTVTPRRASSGLS